MLRRCGIAQSQNGAFVLFLTHQKNLSSRVHAKSHDVRIQHGGVEWRNE